MTDLLRLATELERSGGVHRFIGLVQAASLVLLRFEHGESVTVRGERWPLPAVEGAPDADVTVGGRVDAIIPAGGIFAPPTASPSITHAPDSPIPDLVREPGRKLVPRPWQRPTDPTIAAEDPA